MNAIEIRNLTKKYGKTVAVDSLSLDIKEGELFSLLGVNGAGKTTTIKMLSCLTLPDSGDAFLLKKSIKQEPDEVKKLIAVSPQESAVAPNLSARENLLLMAGVHGFSKEEASKKAEELSLTFGLSEILEKKTKILSGGWKRRLSIAMALICEPKILFLDEPTLGLDVLARAELWDIIRALKGKVTVILTTHYMEEAEALSDNIAIMKNGTLIAVGTADELKQKAGAQKFEEAFITLVKEVKQ
jgi:ABC-2 type transport system ATP-binding protein